MGGIGCKAWLAMEGHRSRLNSVPIPEHQPVEKNPSQDALERRIYAMAKRWDYSGDELALVLEGAKADPVGWSAYCDYEETLTV